MKLITRKLLFILSFCLFSAFAFSQERTITGKVVDGTGAPIPGATVVVKGTSNGTITDVKGVFSIEVPKDQHTLEISFVGMLTQDVDVTSTTKVDVTLKQDLVGLDEVVVVGYGTVKQKNVTGSVSTVKTSDLPDVATTSIDNMLQGRAAGLNLSLRSAQPGGGLNVNIRGNISPNGSNEPLYVIDGVPITDNNSTDPNLNNTDLGYSGGVDRSPLNAINPDDIESIDILKDASAAAIYGSAAANGVILITTKKGKAGKIRTSYSGSYSIQHPKPYIQFLDAKDFMIQHNRLYYDNQLYQNNIAPYGTGDSSTFAFTPRFSAAQIANAGKGTDWIGEIMRDGYVQQHNISISGGNENTTIYASYNFYDNKAVLKNSDLKRNTGRINLDQKLGKHVTFHLSSTYSQINDKNVSTGAINGGVEKYNMLEAATAFAPTIGVYDSSGSLSRTYDPLINNPVGFLQIQDQSVTNRLLVAPNLEVRITDALKVNFTGGIDQQTGKRSFYLPIGINAILPTGMAQLSYDKIGNYSSEDYLTYHKSIGGFSNLTVTAGVGYYKTLSENFSLQGVDFFTNAFGANNVGIASSTDKKYINSGKTERTKISQFLRINYSIKDKYILTFNARRDAASNFSKNHKSGIFPGISAAWRISGESFMKNATFVNDLKLRAGYGTAGNESITTGTNALALYSTGDYNYLIGTTLEKGVALTQIDNPNLKWETDVNLNGGLDFTLFNERLSGSIDIYDNTAHDLLDYTPLPSNDPVGRVATNVGATRSKGFDFSLKTRNTNGEFKWSTTLTFSHYKTYWVKRNPQVALASYIGMHDQINAIYGFKSDGIIKTKAEIPYYMPDAKLGNIKYLNLNNDSTLDSHDVANLGSKDPKFTFGFGNTFSYKRFDLNIYFYGFLDAMKWNGYAAYFNPSRIDVANPSNVSVQVKDVWSTQNPNGIYPGVAANIYDGNNPVLTDPDNPTGNNSDFYLQKVNFVRLKNITLGYNFSNKVIQKLKGVESLRLYVDVQNPLMLTNYHGYDPELNPVNPYPEAVTTTFGLNVSF